MITIFFSNQNLHMALRILLVSIVTFVIKVLLMLNKVYGGKQFIHFRTNTMFHCCAAEWLLWLSDEFEPAQKVTGCYHVQFKGALKGWSETFSAFQACIFSAPCEEVIFYYGAIHPSIIQNKSQYISATVGRWSNPFNMVILQCHSVNFSLNKYLNIHGMEQLVNKS